MKSKVAIIGGGASGMFLACKLNSKDFECIVFEKNSRLGKKLLLTGNGRCNFSNADFFNIESKYNSEFVKPIYEKYDNNSFIAFMNEIGISVKSEVHKGIMYYYPNSNKSTSVYYNLLDKIIANGVKVLYESDVLEIKKENNVFNVKYTNIKKNEIKNSEFDIVIIATGGRSYENTGSTGKGYELAKNFSHSIIKPLPALCGLKLSKDLILDVGNNNRVNGVRVDAKVSAYEIGNTENIIADSSGEVQFTNFGISGIPIMNISGKIARAIDNGKKIKLCIDFGINDDFIDRREKLKYKRIADFLCGVIPDELANLILGLSVSDFKNRKNNLVSNITEKEIDKIKDYLHNFQIDIVGTADFSTAQVTTGGISTSEIDDETMESKLVANLYFMGEIIDVDGICGGYNLQFCYSTASVVANSIYKKCNKKDGNTA